MGLTLNLKQRWVFHKSHRLPMSFHWHSALGVSKLLHERLTLYVVSNTRLAWGNLHHSWVHVKTFSASCRISPVWANQLNEKLGKGHLQTFNRLAIDEISAWMCPSEKAIERSLQTNWMLVSLFKWHREHLRHYPLPNSYRGMRRVTALVLLEGLLAYRPDLVKMHWQGFST